MATLVVMTVGRSDVQWLGRMGALPVRLPLNDRETQQALLAPDAEVHWCHDPAVRSWPELPGWRGGRAVATHLAAGQPLVLFAPKLVPWLSALHDGGNNGLKGAAECLILHTEREPGTPFAAEEPVAAAPLIARWLASAPWHWPVQLVHGLRGREDAAIPADQRRAATRLMEALVGARSRGCDHVLLLDSGGLTALKEVVRLLCQSVFGPDQVERLVHSRQQPAGHGLARDVSSPITPLRMADLPSALASIRGAAPPPAWPASQGTDCTLESELRIRLAAADLIRRCHLASLPALLPDCRKPGAPRWAAQVAASVAWYTEAGHSGPCTSWPGGPLPGGAHLLDVGSGPPAAWAQAFRIECALASSATLEALTLTVEWFEALLAQAILYELRQWLLAEQLTLAGDGTVVGLDGLDPGSLAHCLEAKLPRLEPGGAWGVTRPDGTPVVMLALLPAGRRPAAPVLVLRRLSRHAIQAWCGVIRGPWGPALGAFHDALRLEARHASPLGEPISAYQLRNLKAHQGSPALGPDAARRVRRAMSSAGLWHADPDGVASGQHFLGRPLPAALLSLLGLPRAAEQFQAWLGALERLVREAPLEFLASEPAPEV